MVEAHPTPSRAGLRDLHVLCTVWSETGDEVLWRLYERFASFAEFSPSEVSEGVWADSLCLGFGGLDELESQRWALTAAKVLIFEGLSMHREEHTKSELSKHMKHVSGM